jgi:hypothetical protein
VDSTLFGAILPIQSDQLVSCDCGGRDLAWVKNRHGRKQLVETSTVMPFFQGDGPEPHGLWAVRYRVHRCPQYRDNQPTSVETMEIRTTETRNCRMRPVWRLSGEVEA